MRKAETVLGVIRDRGSRGLPLEDVYRQLYNPGLYLYAYGRIYGNRGAMTQGTTGETVDGMSLDKIHAIIEALRFERWRWTPVRRVYIPKKNGKMRPLGIPTWSDKLLQEVIRLLLEAYYEPQFSSASHGFRTHRGCHTALTTIREEWKGTKWFIEGDIKGCFDNIDHTVLLTILRENIHDARFLRLVEGLLRAGYCEDWRWQPTLSGTPQGGVISPLLANIYLHQFDQFVERILLPRFTHGERRKPNPAYRELHNQHKRHRYHGRWEEAKPVLQKMRALPSQHPSDPDYRRLRYLRYADDFLLGFVGPKAEAEAIKTELGQFLKETLHLELSPEKTLITHATTGMARFLGYEITAQHANSKIGPTKTRSVNGRIALRVPASFIEAACRRFQQKGKAIHRRELCNDSDFDIVARYQSEYRGYVEYYSLATNLNWLNKLFWVMRRSLLKTLACKYKSNVGQMAAKYQSTVLTAEGPRRCYKVTLERAGKNPLVTYFGGLSLKRRSRTMAVEQRRLYTFPARTELVQRLLAERCEVCGSTKQVEVHHIRKLADLNVKGRRAKPLWKKLMAARRRKTLVLCRRCHLDVHAGRPLVTEGGTD